MSPLFVCWVAAGRQGTVVAASCSSSFGGGFFEIFSAACEVILLCAPDLGHGIQIVHCFTPSVAGITVLDTGQKVSGIPVPLERA